MHFLKFLIVPQSGVVKAGMKSEMQSIDNKAVRWGYFGNIWEGLFC